ncbi:MAG: cell division protein FtsW [Ruminococcaceae bacterium]|nr:cell division protein FtsW [Oscillospiraceae bacterium]
METSETKKKRTKVQGKIDVATLVVTLVLVFFGLIMMYSASYASAIYMFGDGFRYIRTQAIYAVLGIIAMLVISNINYRILHRFSWLILGATMLLMLITLFMPEINGARRWIIIGGFTFQPSELMKFAVICIISHLASVNPKAMRDFKYGFLQPAIILIFVVGIMLLQRHLSGLIIILMLAASVMFLGGTRTSLLMMSAAVAGLVILAVVLSGKFDYALSRFQVWRGSPETKSMGYQTFQSLVAIGSGGLFGLGLGNSRQKHLYLPEPHNDFIFAIICEELGLVAALTIIALFIVFIIRGLRISLLAKDRFGALLAMGITLQVGIQALLNIAVVSNTIPNTGISLPFFSQGGTSLVILLAEVGVLLSVSKYSGTLMPVRKAEKGGD